eukprot:943457_1
MALDESSYSTTVSIIYFALNIVFMFGLALYVYKSGNHQLKSKSYVKDVWSQRKIFLPLIIHFYDTATDIGVIYNWGELMNQETGEIDYESVDMNTFFWCGVAFLIVFRVGMLLYSIKEWWDGDGEWYYVLLVLLDLYIFVVVYESFNEAQGVITSNAEKRQQNAQKKKKKRQEETRKQLEEAVDSRNIRAIRENKEVEPQFEQMLLQLAEAVTESMPQIVLQSV